MDIKKEHKETGMGITIAILTTYGYFFHLPGFIKENLWPKNMENPEMFHFLFISLGHLALMLITSFIYNILYTYKLEFFEKYRVHSHKWPWEENPEEWKKLRNKSIVQLFINICVIIPGFLFLKHIYLGKKIEFRYDWDSCPMPLEIIWQTAIFLITEDFWFYWIHRFLHWDKIYPYIHKVHHEHKVTVSYAAEYAHPIELIFGNLFPVNFGPMLLEKRVHLITLYMWVFIRLYKTSEAHSGFEFTWSPIRLLPMQIPSDFHSYHHLKFKGNYGSFFRFWDTFCGTVNKGYLKCKKESKLD